MVDDVLKRFDEYISWLEDVPETADKSYYIGIINKIRFDLEASLKQNPVRLVVVKKLDDGVAETLREEIAKDLTK